MATNGNRDVTLAVGIKTSGEDALRSLAAEVQNLAKRGGDAAPAYQALANELSRLSQQAGQLEAFKALSADVERLSEQQSAAAASSRDLAEQLARARAATVQAAEAEAVAQAELKQTRDALAGKRYELAQLNIETTGADRKDADYIATSKRLRQEILDGLVAVRGRKDALREAGEAAEVAEVAERKLATQYERSVAATEKVETALAAQRSAMANTVATAEQLGLSITDVAQAEEKLLAAQQKIVAGVAEARVAALREQAAADRLALIEQQALAEQYEKGRIALLAETAAINDAAEVTRQYAAAQAALKAAAQSEADRRAAIAASIEQAEADRLAMIEARGLAELYERGRVALVAENAAIKEATTLTRQFAQAQAEASAKAAEALREAFGNTGVRSLQAVQAEIARVGQSLNLLEANYRAGSISAADLARATSSAQVRLAQLRQELNTIPALPNVFERMNASINDLISRFGSLSAAVATFGFIAKPIIDADIQLEQLRRTLTAVTGSAAEAGRQIDFLRKTANDNGLQVNKLANEYTTFVTSLLKSGVSMKDTQNLFAGVASAANTLGLSTERASLVLLALGQVASKGKVSLEEVQSQIGESLPGALKIMADSLGITTSEFTKLVASGNLLADEFLPKFGQGLLKTFGGAQQPVDGLAQAFAKLSNKFTELQQKLVDTAFYKGLVATIQTLTVNFDVLVASVGSLTKAFVAFKAIDIAREFFGVKAAAEASAAAKVADAQATGRLALAEKEASVVRDQATAATARETAAVQANTAAKVANAQASIAASSTGNLIAAGLARTGQAVSSAVSAIGGLTAALGGLPGLALTATIAFSDQIGKALADFAARITGLKATLDQQERDAQTRAGAERARNEERIRQNEEQRASVARLLIDTQKQIDQAESAVKVAENLAQAKKTEGEATAELARLTGSEVREREAAVRVARDNEAAQVAVAAAYDRLIEAEKRQRQVLIDNKGGVENLNAAEKERLLTISTTIKELEAKKAKVDETIEKDRALALAAQLSAEKLRDQSGALQANQQQLEVARASLAQMIELQRQGVVSSESVRLAREAEAAALARVNTSLDQRMVKMRQEQQLRSADIDLTQAKLQQNLSEERTLQALAEGNRDLVTAEQSKIRQKQISLDITKAEIEQALQKARVDRQVAEEELRNRVDLTDAQKRDLELKIALARASEAEAVARQKNTSAIEAEIRAMRNRLAASSVAQTAGKIDGSGTEAFNASVKNPSGVGAPVDASYVFDLWARYQAGALDVSDLAGAKNALRIAKQNAAIGGPGSVSAEGRIDDQQWITRLGIIVSMIESMEQEANNAANKSTSKKSGTAAPSSSATSTTTSASASASATPASRTTAATPVTINIDGRSLGIVNVAGASDAAALQAVLTQLLQAQGRSA